MSRETHSATLSPSTLHEGPAVGCTRCDAMVEANRLHREAQAAKAIVDGAKVRFREGFGVKGLSEMLFTVVGARLSDNGVVPPREYVHLSTVLANGKKNRRSGYVTDLVLVEKAPESDHEEEKPVMVGKAYRQFLADESNALVDHANRVNATYVGGTIYSMVFRAPADVLANENFPGSVRDLFLRDLPTRFHDAAADVRLISDDLFSIRMRRVIRHSQASTCSQGREHTDPCVMVPGLAGVFVPAP